MLFVTLGLGLSGFDNAGYLVNLFEICPKFSALIMGIANTASVLGGILAPIVAKAIAIEVCMLHMYVWCSNISIYL